MIIIVGSLLILLLIYNKHKSSSSTILLPWICKILKYYSIKYIRVYQLFYINISIEYLIIFFHDYLLLIPQMPWFSQVSFFCLMSKTFKYFSICWTIVFWKLEYWLWFLPTNIFVNKQVYFVSSVFGFKKVDLINYFLGFSFWLCNLGILFGQLTCWEKNTIGFVCFLLLCLYFYTG